MLTFRVPLEVAARVEVARGAVPRSEWLAGVLVGYLDRVAAFQVLTGDEVVAGVLGSARLGPPGVVGALSEAFARSARPRCSHGARGSPRRPGWCAQCGCLVDRDGWPVLPP